MVCAAGSMDGVQGPPGRPPAPPGLSWTDADALTRKLATIESLGGSLDPRRKPTRLEVTEAELNSYLNLSLASQIPPGVADLRVRLHADEVEARAVVDIDRVRGQVEPAGSWGPFAFFGGSVPVELRARLTSEGGFGSVRIERASIGSMPVPVAVLEQLVASATKTAANPGGFALLTPFRLPYSLRRVRIQPGRVWLDF